MTSRIIAKTLRLLLFPFVGAVAVLPISRASAQEPARQIVDDAAKAPGGTGTHIGTENAAFGRWRPRLRNRSGVAMGRARHAVGRQPDQGLQARIRLDERAWAVCDD